MLITVSRLRKIISECLKEARSPGGLRSSADWKNKRQQYKIGKVEDVNREVSAYEADDLCPGSVDAWVDIVPELFPNFPFETDRPTIVAQSIFYKEGANLTVSFKLQPQITLATWDVAKQDWIETEFAPSEL